MSIHPNQLQDIEIHLNAFNTRISLAKSVLKDKPTLDDINTIHELLHSMTEELRLIARRL